MAHLDGLLLKLYQNRDMRRIPCGILFVLFVTCKSTGQLRDHTHERNVDWQIALNQDKDLRPFYLKDAVFVNDKGGFLVGSENSGLWTKEGKLTVDTVFTKVDTLAREGRGIYYEVGGFISG